METETELEKRPVQIFVLMGTAGCGKSSIGEEMQKILKCAYIEGDSLHSKRNVDKMASGHPLNDDDRWPWLGSIRNKLVDMMKSEDQNNIIVTCSALRKVYRDIIRDIPADGMVTFVYLKGSKELLLERISSRQGHFMSPSMLDSQLNTLEEPDPIEEQVIVADIRFEPSVVARNIVQEARKRHILPSKSTS